MVRHAGALNNLGLDPVDPMAKLPVSFDVSVSTYGAFWRFLAASRQSQQLLHTLERSAFDYSVYSGTAPDAFGAYTDFGFVSYFIWFKATGDVVVDYTKNNINSWLIMQGNRQYILPLNASGFRIRNDVLGSNIPYQLVVYR